jgi:hypothetical protein
VPNALAHSAFVASIRLATCSAGTRAYLAPFSRSQCWRLR